MKRNEDEIQQWIELNTFECPYGLGRISPEQCNANRQRPEAREYSFVNNVYTPIKPKVCISCQKWKKLIDEVISRRNRVLEKNYRKLSRRLSR